MAPGGALRDPLYALFRAPLPFPRLRASFPTGHRVWRRKAPERAGIRYLRTNRGKRAATCWSNLPRLERAARNALLETRFALICAPLGTFWAAHCAVWVDGSERPVQSDL